MTYGLRDTFGRLHDSLRVSVTDRCNIRCFYCMPERDASFAARREILSYEEIERFVRIAAGLGITKIRITGGEPLVRRDLPHLVRSLAAIPRIEDLALTTNGVLLAEMGDIKRFRRSRSLANYSLLGPKSDDTGEDPPPGQAPLGRHLGQRGNRVLKWAFIEAAHGAVRHGGQCREKFNRATNNGRRDRGRGYIKVGRSLVDVVYAVLRDQRMYQERRPNQPPQSVMNQSDKAKSRVTRPGMGRLYHPMVAAGK